jgi:hypothetical protein
MIRHKGRSTGQLWEHKGNAGSLRIINSLLPNWGFGSCRLIDARPAAVTSLLIFRNRVFFAAPGPLADCITMREDLVRPHQSSTVRRTTILSSSALHRVKTNEQGTKTPIPSRGSINMSHFVADQVRFTRRSVSAILSHYWLE